MTTPDNETTPHDEPAIRVEGLEYEFEVGLPVLHDVSFEVPRGAICGVLGRNGSGKTTLLRSLLGFLETEADTCRVLGLDPMVDAFELRMRVGYVPQVSVLDWGKSAEEHLDFVRPLYDGRWNQELEEKLIDGFGLWPDLTRPARALSPGQRQQLALVLALAYEPELLVLDEPTAGLDPVIRRCFAEQVVEFVSKPGRTVVLSSHLVGELERLVDHVLVIEGRRALVSAPLEALKNSLLACTVRLPGQFIPELPGDLLVQRRSGDILELARWDRDGVGSAWFEELTEQGFHDLRVVDPSLESLLVHLVEGDAR